MSKRNLLINEPPLQVLPSLAMAIGLNEAIALQQLHYWLENPKIGKEIDGHKWVYNDYEEWQRDNFPFWSVRTVQRIFLSLESCSVVISMQPANYDRTKYYRIDYDKLAQWTATDCNHPNSQDDAMEDDKEAHSSLTENTKPETTQKKGDPLDGILHYHLSPKAIQDAIRDFFKLTPNWETKFNREFMQWAVGEKVLPEQVKVAADLWRRDKRFNWSVPTLKGIQEHWLELINPNPFIPPAQTEPKAFDGIRKFLARGE